MGKKTVVIISLNYRVAHVAHLVASYYQMEELGYKSILCINPKLIPFIPKGLNYVTSIRNLKSVDVALFWFPAFSNIKLMLQLKIRFHSRIIYVFHEPLEKFNTYRNLGLSKMEILKIYLKYIYSLLFLIISDSIILPSKKALNIYKDSFGYKVNRNISYIPLLFNDESFSIPPKREFISYIGTIARDHAFNEFINFILSISENNHLKYKLKFLIATRNLVPRTPDLDKLIQKGILKIIEGKPLTDYEINLYYAKSYVVWNAYNRTTQSGVLAKASMFGTPAIVKKDNLSEFSIDGYNVKAVSSNTDIDELFRAVNEVIANIDIYSKNSRQMFESTFYYRVHNDQITSIIKNL
ncbi:MAG: glycosyltransferase [Bacteroides sp.]|nr:glycosyltransferase [Bacteroides sp.]